MKRILDTPYISAPGCELLCVEFETNKVVKLDQIVYSHPNLLKIYHIQYNPVSETYKASARKLTESELTKHKEDMKNPFLNYNSELLENGEDTYQGSFKVDESTGKVSQNRQFHEGMYGSIKSLYAGINKGVMRVSSLDQNEFSGMKEDKFNLGLDIEYSTETIKTFPYRFGVLTWKSGDTRFYKLGIKVMKTKVK